MALASKGTCGSSVPSYRVRWHARREPGPPWALDRRLVCLGEAPASIAGESPGFRDGPLHNRREHCTDNTAAPLVTSNRSASQQRHSGHGGVLSTNWPAPLDEPLPQGSPFNPTGCWTAGQPPPASGGNPTPEGSLPATTIRSPAWVRHEMRRWLGWLEIRPGANRGYPTHCTA